MIVFIDECVGCDTLAASALPNKKTTTRHTLFMKNTKAVLFFLSLSAFSSISYEVGLTWNY
jgi:hypothetical protein